MNIKKPSLATPYPMPGKDAAQDKAQQQFKSLTKAQATTGKHKVYKVGF